MPPPRQVVGVIADVRIELREQRPALLVHDPVHHRLEALSEEGSVTLVTAQEPIAQVAVSSSANELAYLTSGGRLGVYSTPRRAQILYVTEEIR